MATKFLQLARAAIESVEELTSGDSNQQQQRLKLNKLQCKFVAEKLASQTQDILNALELMFAGSDSAAAGSLEQRYEEALKEVYRVVTDALSLIKDSCGEKWLLVAIRQRAGNNLEDFAKVLYEIEWCTSILCSIYVPRNTSTSSGRQTVIFEPEGCNGKLSAFDLFKLERFSNQDRDSLRSDLEHLRQGHVCDSSREVCLRLQNDECIAAQLLEKLDKWPANSLTDDPVNTVENLAAAVPSLWKVDPRDLKKGKKLGKGAFGKVYETKWLTENYAKKVFHRVQHESFTRESDILARFCHPNVVRTMCWSEDKKADKFSLVMDLMTEDLCKFLHRVPRLSIPAAVNLMLQVAEALKYLHGKGPRGLVHRDLKSLNILVRPLADAPELKYEEGYLNPKIADFGEAKIKTLISNFERRFTTQTQDIGTRNWMAPEMFKITQDAYIDHESPPEHARFNPSKADVYSFGLVCFELLTREVPYVGVEPASLPTQITKYRLRPQLPESCPGRLAILIQSCWKSEPRERPNFREICREMRYIKGLLLRGNYTPFLLIRVSKLNSGIQSWGSSHVETCNFEKKHNALKLPI
jgi:serine/threonine protein kinase